MEDLSKAISAAVSSSDYQSLQSIFRNQWTTVGSGEQRSLAAHFIVCAVVGPNNGSFLTESLQNGLIPIYQAILQNLPSSPIENAADSVLRKAMFDHLVEQQDYKLAAEILAGTRMEDAGVYAMSASEKANLWISVAECFLAEDATTESESAVNRAGVFMEQLSSSNNNTTKSLKLRYKTTYARVLDANRKFLNAGTYYYELSLQDSIAETLQLLERAATCIILAPSSAQRDRAMALLVADERLEQLDTPVVGTLVRKLARWRGLVAPTDPILQQFAATLQPHQQALAADNTHTIFQKCILQHNLQAASHLYDNLYLSHLASNILGVSETEAAELLKQQASGSNNVRSYSIDQVDGVVEFFDSTGTSAGSSHQSRDSVAEFCTLLNSVAADIKA